MSFSGQRSAVESFKFKGKNMRTVPVLSLGKCPVDIDVSKTIGYTDGNNGRKEMQRHVPEKYKVRLGDVEIDTTQANMVLLTGYDHCS